MSGPLLLHDRVEVSSAIIALNLVSMFSDGKHKIELSDFIPEWDGPREVPQTDPEQIMNLIKSLESRAKRRKDGR